MNETKQPERPKSKPKANHKNGRVMIVDDHPIVRHGLAQMIANTTDLEVCGEAARAAEALQMLETAQPNLIVIDISLEDGSGLELIKQVKARDGSIRMLVTSMHDEEFYAERALRAGAMGYINKEQALDHIVEAIRRVLRGRIYVSEKMAKQMLHRVMQPSDGRGDQSPIHSLSDRELEVFELMGKGLTTRQIAERLKRSPKTIETHREHIKSKLNVTNNNQLLKHAVQWALEEK